MTAATKERVIGLWLDADPGADEPRWIVSRDEWQGDEPASTHTLNTFDEDEYRGAEAKAVYLADLHGLAIIKTDRYGVSERFRERPHRCQKCGCMHPEAKDQTDPGGDEVTIDARGLVAPNE